MKTATFPPLRAAPELREAVDACLEEGETISAFLEESIRENLRRRLNQREFVARGLLSLETAREEGRYVSSDSVIDRLEKMLAASKTKK